MAGAALLCALQAKADLVKIGFPFEFQGNASPTQEAELIQTTLGLPYTPTFLAKFEDGNKPPSGPNVGNFNVPPFSGSQAPSSWDLTEPGYDLVYALVKAGQWYQLYGVLLGSNQDVIGDWVLESPLIPTPNPNDPETELTQQDISHITFFGKPSNGVPDGGLTAMLLGLGLAGLGVGRRLIRK